MILIKDIYFANCYRNLLKLFDSDECDLVTTRDALTMELNNVCLVVEDPYFNLYYNERRSSQKKYIAAETIWYLSGDRKADTISRYAKMWDKIKNQNGDINSNYGYLIWHRNAPRTQYAWALNCLLKDKNSRQAIIRFNNDEHQDHSTLDFVCTMYGIFHIRDNKLNFTIHMRSSDVIYGLPTDFTWFTILQQNMLMELQREYPELKMGTFTYIGNSVHIYYRHFTLYKEMLEHNFTPDKFYDLDVLLYDSQHGKFHPIVNYLRKQPYIKYEFNSSFCNELIELLDE